MLVDYKNEIVFLSNTKVASTSLEQAIFTSGKLMGRITGHPFVKHINFSGFTKLSGIISARNFTTVCVIRDPLSKARSWYKYRSRRELVGKPRSTRGISFEKYIETVRERDIDDRYFIYDAKSGRRVDLVFKYERLGEMTDWLRDVYGAGFQLGFENKSPDLPLPETPKVFTDRFQDAIDWYESMPPAPAPGDLTA